MAVAVRELRVKATSEGLEKLATDLDRVAAGQRTVMATAGGMAVVTDTSTKRQLSAASALRGLESRLDGVTRANRAYEASQKTLERAMSQGLVTETRRAELLAQAELQRGATIAQAQARQQAQMRVSNQNDGEHVNRFGLRGYQTSNLAYQAGDVFAQGASGTGFAQIAMMQGPQIAQILAEAEGGVKGVAEGLLSFATPLNLAVAGFAALGAGALYFATRTKEAVVPLNDALAEHRAIISSVAKAYGTALDEASGFTSGAATMFQQRFSAAQLQRSINSSLLEGLADKGLYGRRSPTAEFAPFAPILGTLKDGLNRGAADAATAIESISERANLEPLNMELQRSADTLVKMLSPAAAAQRQLEELADAQAKLRDTQFSSAIGDLRGFIPDKTTDRDRINNAADRAQNYARSISESLGIEKDRAAALDEINRKERQAADMRALDLRPIDVPMALMERLRTALNGDVR